MIRAMIFYLDGTLVQTEKLTARSYARAATALRPELDDVFDFVASRDDVENGKPDPEIYLLVADQLGIPPSQCLVIEDSPSGVRASLAAGMACIAVSTPFTKQALHAAGILDNRWIVDDPVTLLAVVDRTMACQTGRKRA